MLALGFSFVRLIGVKLEKGKCYIRGLVDMMKESALPYLQSKASM